MAQEFHALQEKRALAEVGEKALLFEGFESLADGSQARSYCIGVQTDVIEISGGAPPKQGFENFLHHACKNGGRCTQAHWENFPGILAQRCCDKSGFVLVAGIDSNLPKTRGKVHPRVILVSCQFIEDVGRMGEGE